ncbi:MAG TPA: electron transfer flavoprotein subunit alpha/FixB family protein [Candidatus Saccharimonadales bacterium]|nr:electron transfer flavoprotein subunit alpha/FixB family protein [Candidatus Saccharimonadales bacterium]
MAGEIWVVGEPSGTSLVRVSAESATLARDLGAASGREVVGVVIAADPSAAAEELARYVPRVLANAASEAAGHALAAVVAPRLAALVDERQPGYVLLGATPDGRDVAGILSALLGWGVLVNAMAVSWTADGPSVEMSVFGGRLLTTSAFTGDHGIVTVRPNVLAAQPADQPGRVEAVESAPRAQLPVVAVVDRRSEAGAAAPIEEARIIVAGGRGVGGPEGFRLLQEIADALGGSVGATRAAVDAGWINYASQIGQTGKVVKPSLYLALGISGAIQHRVGMQTAETIVAVNRDPDAPLAEFADLYVVGDLFEVGPALLAELRARPA